MGITLLFEETDVQKGSFKIAYRAICEPCVPGFTKTMVCAKQAFISGDSTVNKTPSFPVFDDQVSMLITEMKSLVWAAALLEHVYEFIDSRPPSPDFDIPVFHFVKAALGSEGLEKKPEQRQAYLIEEYIDPVDEGSVRFIIL